MEMEDKRKAERREKERRQMSERRGPNRCDSEDGFCPLHNHLEDERKEYREMVCSKIASKADAALNNAEHLEIRKSATTAATLAEETRKNTVQWRVFTLFMIILIPLLSWMSLNHFNISERLAQTEVFVTVMFKNQDKMMQAFNLVPEPLPAKK